MDGEFKGDISKKKIGKPQLLREIDDDARLLARTLVRGARYMALACLDPQTNFPSVSRVLTGTDLDGVPVILVSGLSGHTKALLAEPRCSLLAGEPSKGDPLAHPRISLQCTAQVIDRETADHTRLRTRFLARHPKAALYIDFPDFRFFRLVPERASLNGGFARAYSLPGSDLVIREITGWDGWVASLTRLAEMPNIADEIAAKLYNRNGKGWRVSGIDPAGIDISQKEIQLRHEFGCFMATPSHLFEYIYTKTNLA